MSKHKFKYGTNGCNTYGQIVFCEYCGHVAFDANWTGKFNEMQRVAKEPCPNSPEKKAEGGAK